VASKQPDDESLPVKGERGDQGPRGEKGESGDSYLLAAESAVDRLTKRADEADRKAYWSKWQIKILGVVCAMLIALSIVSVTGYVNTRNLATTIQHGSFTQCISGNQHLLVEQHIWENFISLLLRGANPAKASAEAAALEKATGVNFSPGQAAVLKVLIDGQYNSANIAKSEAEGRQFDNYIQQQLTGRNCYSLYGVTPPHTK
jgi:hypothetical protein